MNKRLFAILFVFQLLYHSINTAKNAILKIVENNPGAPSWSKLFFDSFLVEMCFAILLIVFLMYISNKMLEKSYRWFTVICVHFALYFLSLFAIYVIYDVFLISIQAQQGERTWQYHIINLTYYLNIHFLTYFANVFIIYTYHYLNKIAKIELNRSNLREQLTKAKVNILKYRLHPHFFFNTLNTITNLITTDTKLAQKTLVDFSGLLRDILYMKESNILTLSEEMVILNKYLDILSIRFSDDLIIEVNVEEGLDAALIPSLILQPTVENSIIHGYSYDHVNLKISIEIQSKDQQLICKVLNDGQKLDAPIKYGNGLKNTDDRLMALYGDNYVFQVKNRLGGNGVETMITIPLEFAEQEKKESGGFV